MARVRMNNRRRRGAVLIEMAIVVLLLVTIALGLMEYGWMFMKLGYATNAARQGARVGARPNATNAMIVTAIQNVMTQGNMTGAQFTYNIVQGANVGDEVRVTVTINYTLVGLDLPLIPVPSTLTATTVMAREGA